MKRLLLLLLIPQLALAQQTYPLCKQYCDVAALYRLDTLTVINVPARSKTVTMPPLFSVSYDSILENEASSIKSFPPVYKLSYTASGKERIKRTSSKSKTFYVARTYKLVEKIHPINKTVRKSIYLPATYSTVIEKRLVKPGVSDSVIMVCDSAITKDLILEVSRELLIRGYISDVSTSVNRRLLDALRRYQEDNGLPLCGFNLRTLNMLGIEK